MRLIYVYMYAYMLTYIQHIHNTHTHTHTYIYAYIPTYMQMISPAFPPVAVGQLSAMHHKTFDSHSRPGQKAPLGSYSYAQQEKLISTGSNIILFLSVAQIVIVELIEICLCMNEYIYIYIYTHTHTHIYIYIHTHIHICPTKKHFKNNAISRLINRVMHACILTLFLLYYSLSSNIPKFQDCETLSCPEDHC